MSRAPKITITLQSAALDEDGGNLVLRGVILNDSLPDLLVDETYQREELTEKQRSSILAALQAGEPLPDLELGMRGEKFTDKGNGVVELHDPVYIIDGQQRRHTTITYLKGNPDGHIRLGAKIFFKTTREWERDRFESLNSKRTRVSPGVLLRNRADTHRSMKMLLELTKTERVFVMYNRVSWRQTSTSGELISASTFLHAALFLHSHKTGVGSPGVAAQTEALDKIVEVFGIQNTRENLRTFWGLIDECWGIQKIHFRGKATYMKGTFLMVLARLLSDHHDFWETTSDEKKLFIHAPIRRKLAQFPVDDPEVVRLSGSGGKARDMLYALLRDHINKGKTTKKLRSRNGGTIVMTDDLDEADAA